jgi:hypothetical protein
MRMKRFCGFMMKKSACECVFGKDCSEIDGCEEKIDEEIGRTE